MSTSAVLSQGTKLYREEPTTPGIFTEIPDVIQISGPDATKSEIRVTDLSSSAEQYLGGLPDFGRVQAKLHYRSTNAVHAALFTDFSDTTSPVRNWRIVLLNGTQLNFPGFVYAFPIEIQPNAVVEATFTIRLSDKVTQV